MSRPLPPGGPGLAPPPGAPAQPPPPQGEFGPQIPGLAAPPQPPTPGAMQDIADIVEINNRLNAISDRHPQVAPVVNLIRNQLQQMQMTLISVMPPTQPAAPPV